MKVCDIAPADNFFTEETVVLGKDELYCERLQINLKTQFLKKNLDDYFPSKFCRHLFTSVQLVIDWFG